MIITFQTLFTFRLVGNLIDFASFNRQRRHHCCVSSKSNHKFRVNHWQSIFKLCAQINPFDIRCFSTRGFEFAGTHLPHHLKHFQYPIESSAFGSGYKLAYHFPSDTQRAIKIAHKWLWCDLALVACARVRSIDAVSRCVQQRLQSDTIYTKFNVWLWIVRAPKRQPDWNHKFIFYSYTHTFNPYPFHSYIDAFGHQSMWFAKHRTTVKFRCKKEKGEMERHSYC